jgi:DNA-binding NarL/FixJ family response regulator
VTDTTADLDDETGTEPADDGHVVTVVLLHPDASRRALLERKLARSPEIEVLASLGDLVEGVEVVIEHVPDVVALYPTEDLLDAVSRLQYDVPASAVLVLDPAPEHFAALTMGAAGTLPSGGSEITRAVIGVARDETVLTPDWAAQLVDAIDDLDERVRRLALLTETERDVLHQLADGVTPRDIADANEVAERLVNLHIGYAVAKYQRAVEAWRAVTAHEAMQETTDVGSGPSASDSGAGD